MAAAQISAATIPFLKRTMLNDSWTPWTDRSGIPLVPECTLPINVVLPPSELLNIFSRQKGGGTIIGGGSECEYEFKPAINSCEALSSHSRYANSSHLGESTLLFI